MASKLQQLTVEQRRHAQEVALDSPRMSYGVLARLLFMTMDVVYGRQKTFSKFKVLELIARVPYQSWENVAYVAITHMYADREFSRRVFDRVKEARESQDNEMWHLLILEELTRARGIKENFFLYRILPQIIAFTCYHICWVLYAIKPSWSYWLNAQFEDHAEHEYMEFVAENPQLEWEEFKSLFEEDYGTFESIADLFRQIGHDERMHKEESLEAIATARFQ